MEETIAVDVALDCRTRVTRHGKGEWDGDDIQHTYTIKGWYRSSTGPYKIDPDKKAYAVYVVYSTGDSFHSEEGETEVMMVNQSLEMAQKNVAILEQAMGPVELFLDDGTTFEISVPYGGYFEHLERVDYEPISEVSARKWKLW